MLDYIKKELASRRAVSEPVNTTVEPEDVPSDVLLECAHLFQELDDLTADGTNASSTRDFGGIDIPLDDDLEIETVEVNVGDGRVVDVPGDATAATVKESNYENIKTYDEFVTEAASMIHQLPRESDVAYNARVSALANKLYDEYSTNMALMTNNSFEKISMESAEVPSNVKINFGKADDSENAPSFMTKVKTFFDVDERYTISRKQLDSLKLAVNGGFQRMVPTLKAYVESTCTIPEGLGLWDVCTPTKVIVPKGTNDTFCVVLEYTNEITGKDEYFGWTASTQKKDTEVVEEGATIDLDADEKINMESFVSGTYVTRDQAIKWINKAETEAKQVKAKRPMPTRSYFQEAIDFGSDSAAPPDGDDAPPAVDDATPSVDVNAEAGSDTDVSTNSSDAVDANTDAADKETATVNDVSSEIAEKVAEKTEDETPNNDVDTLDEDFNSSAATFDDDDLASTPDDTSSADATASVDDQLNELDTLANGDSDTEDDSALDNVNDTDFDNMTIDEIIESGSEKLKGMTLDQIKAFIKDNPAEAVQEAFFITKKNVDKEIDGKLRDCLGILNDNKMNIDTLIKAFKGSAHKLNRVLTKASRLKNVYNEKELKSISTLNKSLVDLLMQFKKVKDTKNVSAVKRQILVFTSNANTVAKFVEDRINAKTVQEATLIQEGVFLTPNNVKHKLAKEIKVIYPDLKAIVDAYNGDRLTRGKINKIYRSGSKSSNLSVNTDNVSYSSGKTHVAKTTGYRNLDDLVQTLNKVVRKNKIKSTFSESDLTIVDELLDLFDEYIDGVEGVVYDDASGDVKTVVQNIGKTASKLIEKMSEFYGICSDGDTLEAPTSKDDTAEQFTDDETFDNDSDDTEDFSTSEDESTEDEGSDDVEGVEDDESLTETEDEAESDDDDDEGDED